MRDAYEVLTPDELLRLGLRPIMGGDGTDDPPADPPSDPPADPPADDPPADPPEPTSEEKLAALREENARLSGELAGVRSQPKPEPVRASNAPKTLDEMTIAELDAAADQFEALIEKGDIPASRGARHLGQIEAIRREKVREDRDAAQAPIRNAETKLQGYVTKYPDLKVRGSELLNKVAAQLPDIKAEFGFDINDPRAQIIAVERVVGGHRLGGGMADFQRKKIPVGGTGGGPAGGGGQPNNRPDPIKEVERMYPDQVAYWNKMGYSEEDRKAEAPIVLQRRARRQRQSA